MIGIVVVSHSPELASGAVGLARQMVSGEQPKIAVAAGAGEGIIGTDAMKVSEALAEVSGPDGVLVLMDLGSAVLSTEMALELSPPEIPVRLSRAPFVEGLLAAVVSAASGADLETADAEATGALAAKQEHLGDDPEISASNQETGAGSPQEIPDVVQTVVVRNPLGLHARPAAEVAQAAAALDTTPSVQNVSRNKGPVAATSPTQLMALGAVGGDKLQITANGESAEQAVRSLVALIEGGFGEVSGSDETLSAQITTPTVLEQPARKQVEGEESSESSAGQTISGHRIIGVSPGIGVGQVLKLAEPLAEPQPGTLLPAAERSTAVNKLQRAIEHVAADLAKRAERANGQGRQILEATASLAKDPALLENAERLIQQMGVSPERAAWEAAEGIATMFAELGGRQAERVTDIRDVRDRLIAQLTGHELPGTQLQEAADTQFIVVADDLAPADAALLDAKSCRGIVTAQGGPTSHTAILARTLGIPSVIAPAAVAELQAGHIVIVDGSLGKVVTDPTSDQRAEAERQTAESTVFTGQGATADGHLVALLANLGGASGVAAAQDANAEGVGLFRTEFCFLDRDTAPTLEEQVAAYRPVLEGFVGRKVVVRTLDAGADKPLPFLTDVSEPNPALGVRGYRTSWRAPQVLDIQLQAIAQAAQEAAQAGKAADVWVMAPMIDTVEETADFVQRAKAFGLPTVGIMIETPAAALCAEDLLGVADFASLGTNDLAQYTMAADRVLGDVAELNDPWQPAVLRMVQASAAGGQATSKPVGVCGEAAADPLLATVLVGLGITSLSMTPKALGPVAAQLSAVTWEQCQRAALAAVAEVSAEAARTAASKALEAQR